MKRGGRQRQTKTGKKKKMTTERAQIKITNEQKWAVGLIEAEGNIGINDPTPTGSKWEFKVKVAMKNTNMRAVYKIKKIIGAGRIHRERNGMVAWVITDREKIKEYIYPLLDNYPFRGVKYYEYQILKEGMHIAEEKKITAEVRRDKLIALKEKAKEVIEVTPIISSNPMDWGRKAKDMINEIGVEKLREIYDPWWIAGYVEGGGSLQINSQLQIAFEIAQMYDKMPIYGLHKLYGAQSAVKIREGDGYTIFATKKKEIIARIMGDLRGKMLGMKSWELKVWCYAFNTDKREKREKAKEVLRHRGKGKEAQGQEE